MTLRQNFYFIGANENRQTFIETICFLSQTHVWCLNMFSLYCYGPSIDVLRLTEMEGLSTGTSHAVTKGERGFRSSATVHK